MNLNRTGLGSQVLMAKFSHCSNDEHELLKCKAPSYIEFQNFRGFWVTLYSTGKYGSQHLPKFLICMQCFSPPWSASATLLWWWGFAPMTRKIC